MMRVTNVMSATVMAPMVPLDRPEFECVDSDDVESPLGLGLRYWLVDVVDAIE